MTTFDVNQAAWGVSAKVFSSCPGLVLVVATLYIGGDPCVEGIVGAEDYIDLPAQNAISVPKFVLPTERICLLPQSSPTYT